MTQPQVAVRSTAYRDVAPDSYQLVVRVSCRNPDAGAALASLADGFARVEQAIDALPGRDLTVDRGVVSQRRIMWHPEKDAGPGPEWLAMRQATVTGRDCEHAGSVVSAFAELVDTVDGMELDGPHWRLDRDNPAYGEAQVDAVGAAHVRARRYAEALGGTLGRLIELTDTGLLDGGRRQGFMLSGAGYAEGGMETMNFTPGPIEVSATVDARWALVLP